MAALADSGLVTPPVSLDPPSTGSSDTDLLLPSPASSLFGLSALPLIVRRQIYSILIDLGGSSPLSGYATVSRDWQLEFERFIFAKIHLTSHRLSSFDRIVVGRRRSYVQSIIFDVLLDRYPPYLKEESENKDERQRATKVLTKGVAGLFRSLASWRVDEICPGGIRLELGVFSPSDVPTRSSKSGRRKASSLTTRAYESPVTLGSAELSLPDVLVIGALQSAGRHVDPVSILQVVRSLSKLQGLMVRLNHDSKAEADLRQRTTFIDGLMKHASSVVVLDCRLPHTKPGSRSSSGDKRWSAFYAGLRGFSQQCESLRFDDCVDAGAFFVPFYSEYDNWLGRPHWPRLKYLNARNSYMLKRPYLRSPNRANALFTISGVLVAAGRAAAQMPALKSVHICQYILTDDRLEWFVLSYRFSRGAAMLSITGLLSTDLIIEAWKESVFFTRGVELEVVRISSDTTLPLSGPLA